MGLQDAVLAAVTNTSLDNFIKGYKALKTGNETWRS